MGIFATRNTLIPTFRTFHQQKNVGLKLPNLTCLNLSFQSPSPVSPHRRHSCTDSDTTSYTSALAFSRAEVLRIAYEPSRTSSCKITCRSTPFQIWWWGNPHALQRKATGGGTSEVVRETAGWTRPGLTLGTSTSASTEPSLCGGGTPSLCGGGTPSLCGGGGRR